MKETTPAAMPPCFDRWCKRFDDIWRHQAQKREFRNYIGGLLGESERKNLSQIADNAVGVIYHRLHHFLTEAPWDAQAINERRLLVMNQCSQTRISRGFTLIVDDSGHRKSGNFTAGVGRQYIGEIGKTDNGGVVVTTHLYDGQKSLPLDIELYQHASSLPQGKKDKEIRLDKLAQSLPVEGFTPIQLNLDKPKTIWVAAVEVELSQLEGNRTIAIVMNASTFEQEA
jgi:SRSO17 transposase